MKIEEYLQLNQEFNGEGHFDESYKERAMRIINKILSIYSLDDLKGKKVLVLGDGIGIIGGFFAEAGADVTALEGRRFNCNIANLRFWGARKYKSIEHDLRKGLGKFKEKKFDVILCFGLLEVLSNIEPLLKDCYKIAKEILIDNIVFDTDKREIFKFRWTRGNDRPLDETGTFPSQGYMESFFEEKGFKVERYFDGDLNYSGTKYDWEVKNKEKPDLNKRRFWRFVKK